MQKYEFSGSDTIYKVLRSMTTRFMACIFFYLRGSLENNANFWRNGILK